MFYGEPLSPTLDVGLEINKQSKLSISPPEARVEVHVPQNQSSKHGEIRHEDSEGSDSSVRARVWDMQNPWSKGKYTGEVLTVKRLLVPVPVQYPIRAVGLNYKVHAVSASPSPPSEAALPVHHIT